jgi:uncharacterized protein YkwD
MQYRLQYNKYLHGKLITMIKRSELSFLLVLSILVVLLTSLFPIRGSGSNKISVYAQDSNTISSEIYFPLIIRDRFEKSSFLPDSSIQEDWLTYLNQYRLMANLPPVTFNESWNQGSWNHSRYMVKNNIITHYEDPSNIYFSIDGDLAGKSGNLAASYNYNSDDRFAFDTWMQAPFHAVSILDPVLLTVGYGSYRENGSGLQMAATLDVLRGRDTLPEEVEFPIMWPGDGKTVNINHHWGEYPSPLTSCPGYQAPTGLPIILQLGSGSQVPQVTAHSFYLGDSALEHCVFDETNYQNPNDADRELGRAILSARNAIVLIAREPLQPGVMYTASITTNNQTYTWSFFVGTGQ